LRRPTNYPAPAHTDSRDKRPVSIIGKPERVATNAVSILGVPFDGDVLGRRGAAEGLMGVNLIAGLDGRTKR